MQQQPLRGSGASSSSYWSVATKRATLAARLGSGDSEIARG